MSETGWIRDKIVAAAEAEAVLSDDTATEIIWQLSKELHRMVKFGEYPEGVKVIGDVDPGVIGDATIKGRFEPTAEMLAGTEPVASEGPGPEGFDVVKRPAHYAEGRKYEPKDVIRDWGLNFNLGAAVKYCSRANRKADAVEDLEKAVTFIQFEIDALRQEREARLKERSDGSAY